MNPNASHNPAVTASGRASKGIRNRVLLWVTGLVVLVFATGGLGLYEQSKLSNQLVGSLGDGEALTKATHLADATSVEVGRMVGSWQELLLTGHTQDARDEHWSAFQASEAQVMSNLEALRGQFLALGFSPESVDQATAEFAELAPGYRDAYQGFDPATDPTSYRYAQSLADGLSIGAAESIAGLGSFLSDQAGAAASGRVERVRAHASRARNLLLIAMAVAFLYSVLAIASLVKTINGALTRARSAADDAESMGSKAERENELLQGQIVELLDAVANAADGDITVRAPVNEGALGNVADAFNLMMENLEELIGDVKSTVVRVADEVDQIEAAASHAAQGADHQVSSLGDARTSVSKISDQMAQVSSNAEAAVAAAKRAQDSAINGSEAVHNVIQGMDVLRANVQAGAKKIKNLGDRSMEITSIVATIAKISEQTNMLALNAAIEAARAGEHGRGFSVVADEVRRLAERTAAATHEIRDLVSSIQAETTESVAAIEQQTLVVEEESQAVNEAGQALLSIQDVSTQSAALIADISSTAQSQAAGVASVVTTMEGISTIAAESRQGAQSTLEIARTLNEIAEQLGRNVAVFKTGMESASFSSSLSDAA